jgi:hypothetical protein
LTDQSLPSSSAARTVAAPVQAWTPPGRPLAEERDGLVRGAILRLDAWLRRKQDFIEYSTSPTCILRVVVTEADTEVRLSDGVVVAPGELIIDLHFWNERMPQTTSECQGLAWGGRFGRQLMRSIAELAHAVGQHPRLCDAVAVRARLSPSGERDQADAERFAHWFGFEYPSARRPPLARRLHDAAEDIWLLMLAWTFNPGSLRTRSIVRRRDDLWISKAGLVERYVASKPRRRTF